MKAKHVALLSILVAAAAVISALPSDAPAQAQAAGGKPLTIATANPSKVFFGMKEKTEVEQRLAAEREAFVKEGRSREQKVQDLRNALSLLKPDAPQYEQANTAYTEAAVEHKVWTETQQIRIAQNEKKQTKMLFDRITAGIAELAKERNIDIVFAEAPQLNVEKMSAQDLTQLMAQRQVLYTNANVDLTQDVITKLDEKFNAGKK